MKYFYFNPNTYSGEYHVMAETVEAAWKYVEDFARKEFADQRKWYEQIYVSQKGENETLEQFCISRQGTFEEEFRQIKSSYTVEEFGEGEVNTTEIS
jgi:hypothetical protein